MINFLYSIEVNETWNLQIIEPITIDFKIRYHALEYTDSIVWNLVSTSITPEQFAFMTRTDLQLPFEIEHAIGNIYSIT